MNTTPCSGFRTRRLALGWTIQQTSQLSSVSPYIIRCCEEGDLSHVSMHRLIALSACLGISLDEGCRMRIPTGTRQRPRRHEPRNILENYMTYWELTLEGLALILGVSAQTASIQCGLPHPAMKYIRLLAEEENMTADSFLTMYGNLNIA